MKTALLIVEYPETSSPAEDKRRWLEILEYIQKAAKPTADTKKLSQGVWLIPLASGLPFLGSMTLLSQEHGIPMRVLFLEEEQAWIKYPQAA